MDPKFLEELQKLKEQKNADLDNIDLDQLSIPDFDTVEDPKDPAAMEAEEEIAGGTIKFERVSEVEPETAVSPAGGRRGKQRQKPEIDEETRRQRAKIRNIILISSASVIAAAVILFTAFFGIRNANMKNYTYQYWGMGISINNGVSNFSLLGNLKEITQYGTTGNIVAVAKFDKGNCVKEIAYAADGNVDHYYAHEYDGNTKILSSYYKDGQMVQSVKYTVAEDGSILAETTYYLEDNRTETAVLILDDQGNLHTAQYYDEVVLTHQMTYAGTLVTEEIHYDEAKNVKNRIVYEYNTAKQLLTKTLYNAQNAIQSRTVNQYNEKNLLAKTIEYDGSGAILQYKTFNYDLNENPIKQVTYAGDGTMKSQILKVFNNKNQVTKETALNSDGSIHYCYGYEYDKKGYVSKSIVYNKENSGLIESYTVYTRNDGGNVTECEIYNGQNVLTEKAVYNDAGFMTNLYQFNAVGTLVLEEKTKYDDKQRIIKKEKTNFSDSGVKTDYFCEEYDDKGLVTMRINEIVAENLYEQFLFAYAEEGYKKQETLFDKSGKTVYDRTLDAKERILSETLYENGREISLNEYTYDEKDQIIQKRTLDSTTKVMIKTSYTYNDDGVMIESLDADILNKPIVKKQYDESGLVTMQTNYDADGVATGYYTFEYDEKDRVIVQQNYDEAETFLGKTVYYYRVEGGYDYTVYDASGVAVEDSRGPEYLPTTDEEDSTDTEEDLETSDDAATSDSEESDTETTETSTDTVSTDSATENTVTSDIDSDTTSDEASDSNSETSDSETDHETSDSSEANS